MAHDCPSFREDKVSLLQDGGNRVSRGFHLHGFDLVRDLQCLQGHQHRSNDAHFSFSHSVLEFSLIFLPARWRHVVPVNDDRRGHFVIVIFDFWACVLRRLRGCVLQEKLLLGKYGAGRPPLSFGRQRAKWIFSTWIREMCSCAYK